jgi:hypothetical protein
MQFPWRWNGGTISTNLDIIWRMSVDIDDKGDDLILRQLDADRDP